MSEIVKVKIGNSTERIIVREAVAKIDSELCINCGKCRRICPVEAIEEKQRVICRFCPDCGDSEIMMKDEQEEFATEHACSIGCPLGTTPEGFVNLVAQGRWQDAYDSIAELNPLPSLCAMVCSHPCTDECKRGLLLDKNIDIRGIKRVAVENSNHSRPLFQKNIDTRIAIIGAGPSGLTAAYDLLLKGYRVKIFEKNPQPGGMVRIGVPDFRLDKNSLLQDIQELEKAGMEIEYNAKVGTGELSIDSLKKSGFAAVILATGASKGIILPIDGYLSDKVFDAVTFMQRANSKEPVNFWKNPAKAAELGDMVVIGSGSVALDSARTALRLGAKNVTCACLESRDEMLAPDDEIEDAIEEGVQLLTEVSPQKIFADFITITGIQFAKVTDVDHTDGKFIPIIDKESTFTIKADSLVFAVGQKPDIAILAKNSEIETDRRGAPVLGDELQVKGKPGVFASGDLILKRGSIIQAMASGRKVALQVDNMIQGRNLSDRTAQHTVYLAANDEKIFPIRLEKLYPRQKEKTSLSHRDTFKLVEIGFSKEEAILEASRCMKCGFAEVDPNLCIGCSVCVSGCPQHAITMIGGNVR